ncbi:MAG TPA: ABC transporter permease [Terriglobales bacterium]|nr:ABC transporter permease [Terriglobales bacterium]
MLKRIAIRMAAIVVTILIGLLVSATLVRMAPGFDSDEHQLDSRLSADTIAALKADKLANRNLLSFYATYIAHALHGDLGRSSALGTPVSELIRQRAGQTFRTCGSGLALGCGIGFLFAFATGIARASGLDLLFGSIATLSLCIPIAALALIFVLLRVPAGLAIATVIYPVVYRYARNILVRTLSMPHVITALAKGSGPIRILICHIIPVCAGQFLAIAGISVSLALSASIAIESLCGIPGLGQLAWQSALARDLPVLVTLTALIAVVTILANSLSDLVPPTVRSQGS